MIIIVGLSLSLDIRVMLASTYKNNEDNVRDYAENNDDNNDSNSSNSRARIIIEQNDFIHSKNTKYSYKV